MTVQTSEPNPIDRWVAEDEIDFRKYFDVAIQWWREIAGITVFTVILTVLAILVIRLVLPPQFITSASVAIVRTTSDVNFDERFRTNAEELGIDTASLSARRNALLGLVLTGEIAQEVAHQLQDILSEEEQDPAVLLEMVKVELAGGGRTNSDLINITATSDTPEKSAAIANTWANIYVRNVNTIYGQVPSEVLSSIESELVTAREQYLESQSKLEFFIANNRIDQLNSLSTVLQQRVSQEVSLQQSYLAQWQETKEQLDTVLALRTQIEQGGEGAADSTMVALQILKADTFSTIPANLQVELRDLPQIDQKAMLVDLDALLTSLQQRLATLESQIDNGSTVFLSTTPITSTIVTTAALSSALAKTFEQLKSTKANLEAETARQLQLTEQRNLNWETYQALSNKVAELNLIRAAASSEVRLGAMAVSPIEPARRIGLLSGVLVAIPVGLIFALIAIAIFVYNGQVPFTTRLTSKSV